MQHFILGLDKSKLTVVAQHYMIDIGSILPFIQYYEQKLLERQNIQANRE